MKKVLLFFSLLFLAKSSFAFRINGGGSGTGTSISTSTLTSGSTFFIQNTLSPTTTTQAASIETLVVSTSASFLNIATMTWTNFTSMTFVGNGQVDFSQVNSTSVGQYGVILPQTVDCSSATQEGQICWDTDDDVLYIAGSAPRAMISSRSTLQPNATYYVSSGTVKNQLSVGSIKYANGTIQVSSPPVINGTAATLLLADGSGNAIDSDCHQVASFPLFTGIVDYCTNLFSLSETGSVGPVSLVNGGLSSKLSLGINSTFSSTYRVNFPDTPLGTNQVWTSTGPTTSTVNLTNTTIIVSTNGLQSGATFYTSSGTATNFNSSTITITKAIIWPDGTIQISSPVPGGGSFINNSNSLQSGATFYVSSGTVFGPFAAKGGRTGIMPGPEFIGTHVRNYQSSLTNFGTSNQWADAGTVFLTTGNWVLDGAIDAFDNGATITSMQLGISNTSGNSSGGLNSGDNWFIFPPPTATNGDHASCFVNGYYVNLTASASYYLKIFATYSVATPQYRSRISGELRP